MLGVTFKTDPKAPVDVEADTLDILDQSKMAVFKGSVVAKQGKYGAALFNLTGWNILAIYGVSMMDSGRAAILGYTMPVWSVLLAVWFLGERLTARRAAGVALGMAGMALLLSGEIRALQRALYELEGK